MARCLVAPCGDVVINIKKLPKRVGPRFRGRHTVLGVKYIIYFQFSGGAEARVAPDDSSKVWELREKY